MDKDTLDELERVAQAAGDAEWEVVDYEGGSLVIHADRENRVCFMATPGDSPGQMAHIEARAVHIATFDPPTVLSLLSRLSAAADRERVLVEALEPLRKEFHRTRMAGPVSINALDLARVLDLAFPLTQEPTR